MRKISQPCFDLDTCIIWRKLKIKENVNIKASLNENLKSWGYLLGVRSKLWRADRRIQYLWETFLNLFFDLNACSSPKKMQKQLNIDWKLLCDRLLANKISLNSKKTEMIIFQKPGLKINWDWNIRLNGYKLTRSDQIKYLGIYLDKYLNGHYQTKLVIQKLARSLGMLSKVRH